MLLLRAEDNVTSYMQYLYRHRSLTVPAFQDIGLQHTALTTTAKIIQPRGPEDELQL